MALQSKRLRIKLPLIKKIFLQTKMSKTIRMKRIMLKKKTKTYQKFMVECLGKKLLNIVTNLIGKNKKLKYWKKYRSKNGKNILKICFSLRLVELISDITLKHTKSKKRQQSSNLLMRKIILQSRSLRIQWIYLLTQ